MISNPKMNGVLRKTKDKLNINLYIGVEQMIK